MVVARAFGSVILALVLVLFLEPPRVAAQPDFTAVDEAANDAIASGEIPGVVVLVGRGDTILYEKAYGWREVVPARVPMTTDTIFDLASLTKPFGTALAVMTLVERGEVKLDAPIGRYLPEFGKPAFKQVTIERLLTHSAGLPATPPNGSVVGGFPRAARRMAKKLSFDYPPGSGFQYSDTGFILLGEMVRRVTGLRLDRYLTRTVYRPLGLHDTGFLPPASARRRIAPTQWHDGRMLLGEVHDPRARDMGGVAGHAGLFSTAEDLARICRMLVDGGVIGTHRVFKPSTVSLMWTRELDGNGTRALGWDVISGYARPMAPFFPRGSVGHTGYTGTTVWVDPPTKTYMILLTNRVHPDGGGAAGIRELRLRVSAAVGAALFGGPAPAVIAAAETPHPAADQPEPLSVLPRPLMRVRTGLDVWAAEDFAALQGHAVGLVTNQTGVDARGRRGIDLIAAAPGVRLQAIFAPEHGLAGVADSEVANARDAATGRPVWSLYGVVRRPTAEMLRGVDRLVFDIQDIGVRYYTYLTTLVYLLEEAGKHGIPVVVLDRPNPITGSVVEGPVMDDDLGSFTGPYPLPVRTGMTIGEFARMVVGERRLPVSLTVVPVEGWTRGTWYDETTLPWVDPSPNIRSLREALLYSGVGLLEATNLSVGRGTDMPFEVVGAPWIQGPGLAAALNALGLRGVRFDSVMFTPTADHYAGVLCGGVRLVVTDRDAIRPVTVALAVARTLRERHRDQFRPEMIQNLLVNRSTMWAFLRGEPLDRLVAWAETDRSAFLNRRASYLIYR